MNNKNQQKGLFRITPSEYGNDYQEHLFQQYELYIESTHKISDRRQKNNDFFVTINTALLTFLSFMSQDSDELVFMITIVSAGGVLICYIWYRLIKSYRDLNSGKFKVIENIENKLPLALHSTEWDMLGRGKNSKLYSSFTAIEIKIPSIFVALYCIIVLFHIIVLFL